MYPNTGLVAGTAGAVLEVATRAVVAKGAKGVTDQGRFWSYFARGRNERATLALDYCAALVLNAFRFLPSARRQRQGTILDDVDSCFVHYPGPAKHFWRARARARRAGD